MSFAPRPVPPRPAAVRPTPRPVVPPPPAYARFEWPDPDALGVTLREPVELPPPDALGIAVE